MFLFFFNIDDQKIEYMYEIVLNYVGDWVRVRIIYLVCKIEGDNVFIVKINDLWSVGNVYVEKLLIDDLERNNIVNEINGFFGVDFDFLEDFKKMLLDELKKKCNDKEINCLYLLNIMVYINNFFCFDEYYNCMDKLIKFLDRY